MIHSCVLPILQGAQIGSCAPSRYISEWLMCNSGNGHNFLVFGKKHAFFDHFCAFLRQNCPFSVWIATIPSGIIATGWEGAQIVCAPSFCAPSFDSSALCQHIPIFPPFSILFFQNDAILYLSMSTKKEIAAAVAEKLNITQLAAKEVVQNVLDCVGDTLVEERRIELRNFGVFEIKKRAARNARNPKTGASVKVKERYVATFKAGKTLTEAIQSKKKKSKPSSTETQNRGG